MFTCVWSGSRTGTSVDRLPNGLSAFLDSYLKGRHNNIQPTGQAPVHLFEPQIMKIYCFRVVCLICVICGGLGHGVCDLWWIGLSTPFLSAKSNSASKSMVALRARVNNFQFFENICFFDFENIPKYGEKLKKN